MPIVNFERYCEMLDKAHAGQYAYPAINISNTDTLNAAIEGFVEAGSDGIVQVSTGGGEHASGNLKDAVLGAISLAEHAHRIADRYDKNIAHHTDHCTMERVDSLIKPLITETPRRRARVLVAATTHHRRHGRPRGRGGRERADGGRALRRPRRGARGGGRGASATP